MKSLTRVMGMQLSWSRPRLLRREYELRTAHDLVATLHFESWRIAIGRTADTHFRFEGKLGPAINADISQDGRQVADVAFKFRSGVITMIDGRAFQLKSGWPVTRVLVRDPHDRHDLVETVRRMAIWRQSEVEIGSAGWSHPDLPLLALTSWYVLVRRARRAARAG